MSAEVARLTLVVLFGSCLLVGAVETFLDVDNLPDIPRLKFPTRNIFRSHHSSVSLTDTNSESANSKSTRHAKCNWNKYSKHCDVTPYVLAAIAKKSHSDFARIVHDEYYCRTKKSKEACQKLDFCEWDEETESCEMDAFLDAQKSSPCLKAAPSTIKLLHAVAECSKITSVHSCSKHVECTMEKKICTSDFDYVFFGIKHFDEQTKKVAPVIAQQIQESLMLDPSVLSTKFKVESLLKWKAPAVTCPKKMDDLVCEVWQAYFAIYIPVLVYCQAKHTGMAECNDDPMCYVNKKGSCVPAPSVLKRCSKAYLQTLVKAVPDTSDRHWISKEFKCGQKEKESCSDDCYWNYKERDCSLRESVFFHILAKPGKTVDDGLCKYFDMASQVDCLSILSKKTCEKTTHCIWNSQGECDIGDDYSILSLAETDSTVKKAYVEAKAQCSNHTSEHSCTGHKPQVLKTILIV